MDGGIREPSEVSAADVRMVGKEAGNHWPPRAGGRRWPLLGRGPGPEGLTPGQRKVPGIPENWGHLSPDPSTHTGDTCVSLGEHLLCLRA